MLFCRDCGNEVTGTSKFCNSCGKELTKQYAKTGSKSLSKLAKLQKPLQKVSIISSVLMIVGGLYSGSEWPVLIGFGFLAYYIITLISGKRR